MEHRGRQLNQSRIFFLLAATSLKFLAAHLLLFVAMFRLFCGSGAVARDAETNNDRGEHCMSHFVFPPSAWFSELTLKLTCRGRCESLLSRETVMRPRSGAAPGSAAAKTPGTLKHPKRSRPVTTE